MKMIEQLTKTLGAVAGLCLALGLVAQAEDTPNTTPPAGKGGPGGVGRPGHHRPGQGHGDFKGPQGEEFQKMREKLKDMTPEQRQEAMKKFREKMGDKGKGGNMEDRAAKMKEHIQNNPKLSDEQKKEILGHMAKMREAREKIMKDSSLNEEQKREAMKKLHDEGQSIREKYRDILGPPPGHQPGPPHGQPGDTPPSV